MKTKLLRFIWKVRYARYLKKGIGMPFYTCYGNAGSALDNIDYDLSESPEDSAQDEIYAWSDDYTGED